jgi:hypothetical protein
VLDTRPALSRVDCETTRDHYLLLSSARLRATARPNMTIKSLLCRNTALARANGQKTRPCSEFKWDPDTTATCVKLVIRHFAISKLLNDILSISAPIGELIMVVRPSAGRHMPQRTAHFDRDVAQNITSKLNSFYFGNQA